MNGHKHNRARQTERLAGRIDHLNVRDTTSKQYNKQHFHFKLVLESYLIRRSGELEICLTTWKNELYLINYVLKVIESFVHFVPL